MDHEPVTDNMVVYKLGQIESQLSSIAVDLAKQAAQFDKDFSRQESRISANESTQEATDNRLDKVEKAQDFQRAWLLGSSFVVSIVFILVKVIVPWVLK